MLFFFISVSCFPPVTLIITILFLAPSITDRSLAVERLQVRRETPVESMKQSDLPASIQDCLRDAFRIKHISAQRHVGDRPYQEDEICIDLLCNRRFLVVAVMDGHSGGACSAFLRAHLPGVMETTLMTADASRKVPQSRRRDRQPLSRPPLLSRTVIRTALMSLHRMWLRIATAQPHSVLPDGSTMNGLIIDCTFPHLIWTYNLGDSQTFIYDTVRAESAETFLHDLSESRQQQVIALSPSAAIYPDTYGTVRIHGAFSGLNLSGAYGDLQDEALSRCLLRMPEIECFDATKSSGNLVTILGSDGLWDDVSKQKTQHLITRRKETTTSLTKQLMEEVIENGQKGDNVSIVTIEHIL